MLKSLTDRTVSGLNWNFISNYSKTISTIIIGIVLARLLTPKDFGKIGMVTIFIGFADLFVTLGIGQSLIRIKSPTERHYRVATTFTILSSVIIFIFFYHVAILISEFYKIPELTDILRALSIIFIIKGINTVSFAQLQKKLEFKTITIIAIISNLSYGITSVTFAFLDFGVWSLVYGRLTSAIVSMILTTRQYPVNLKPLFAKNELKELAGFGSGISLSRILLYASSNIDYLVIGKFVNEDALGLYTKSFNLMTNSIDKVSGGMFNVLFPAFSAVQDEKDRLRRAYLRAVKTAAFFIFPVLGFMCIGGKYVILGLNGIKWEGAVLTFQILAVAGLLRATLMFSGSIAHATGKVFIESRQQFFYLLILGIGAYVGVSYGIEGVATAVVIALTWMFYAQSNLALKIINSSWKEFIITLLPALANLFLIVMITLIVYQIIENSLNTGYEIKLILLIFITIPLFTVSVILMPKSIKNDTIDWVIEKYKKFVPNFIQKIYYKFN